MSNIVITGSDGFIGKNLFEKLKDEANIISVDLSGTNKGSNYFNAFDFIELLGSNYFNKIDVIFHNGACSDTMCYDPFYMNKYNFEYSKELFDICLEKQIRIIYASSAAIYGDGPCEEGLCGTPKNLYAKSKMLFDVYASQFVNAGPQVTGLRYFNVYGKYEEKKANMASVVYKFVNQINENKSIKLFNGSKNFYRDFVHIDDICDINYYFYKNNISGIFNAGTGVSNSFLDIANELFNYFEFDIEYIDFPKELVGKYQKNTKADMSRLNSVMEYSPRDISCGIGKYIEYLNGQ